jgi:AcrR family transcriptional regulator
MVRRMPAPRSPSRQLAARERSRDDILVAAARLFTTRGLENTSFGEIARAARVSRPLVYFYFRDHEALFLEAVALAQKDLFQRFVAAVNPVHAGLRQIREIGRAYVAFQRENPVGFQLLAQHGARAKPGQPHHPLACQLEEHGRAVMDLITGTLRRGLKDGTIRRDIGNPLEVGVCLWSFTQGVVQLLTTEGPCLHEDFELDLDATLERAFEMMTASLANPGKPPKKIRH